MSAVNKRYVVDVDSDSTSASGDDSPSAPRVDEGSRTGREVDLADPKKDCENCGEPGEWIFWINRFLCAACKVLPKYRTICRTAAMRTYGLNFEQVIQGQQNKSLQVFFAPNPHAKGEYMKLYFVEEIEAYATYLDTLGLLAKPTAIQSQRTRSRKR